MKPLVGISACIMGDNVRYDGASKLDRNLVNRLKEYVHLLPLCPEIISGMKVPREPMDLFEEDGITRMITLESRTDKTVDATKWVDEKLRQLAEINVCGFIFKSKSPSCALYSTKIYRGDELFRNGRGLFSRAFCHKFTELPVKEESELQEFTEVRDFLKRIYYANGTLLKI